MSLAMSQNPDVIEAVVSKLTDEPTKQAIEDNTIEVGVVESAIGLNDNEVKVILGVNPSDGEFIDFKEACKDGIIDNVEKKGELVLPQLSDKTPEAKIVKVITLEKEPTLVNSLDDNLVIADLNSIMVNRTDVLNALISNQKPDSVKMAEMKEECLSFIDCIMNEEVGCMNEAVERGILDWNLQLFYDNYRDIWMTLHSAFEKGLLKYQEKEMARVLVCVVGVRSNVKRGFPYVGLDIAAENGLLTFDNSTDVRRLYGFMKLQNVDGSCLNLRLEDAIRIGVLKTSKVVGDDMVEIEFEAEKQEEVEVSMYRENGDEELNLVLWQLCGAESEWFHEIVGCKNCLDPLDILDHEDSDEFDDEELVGMFGRVFNVMCSRMVEAEPDVNRVNRSWVLLDRSELVNIAITRYDDDIELEKSFVLDIMEGQLTSLYNVCHDDDDESARRVYGIVNHHNGSKSLSRRSLADLVEKYRQLAVLRHEGTILDVLEGCVDLENVMDERMLEWLAHNGFVGLIRRDKDQGVLGRFAVRDSDAQLLAAIDGDVGRYLPEWTMLRRDCTVDAVSRADWADLKVSGLEGVSLQLALDRGLLAETSVITYDPLFLEVDVGYLDEQWHQLMRKTATNQLADDDGDDEKLDPIFELSEIKNGLLVGYWKKDTDELAEAQQNPDDVPESVVIYGVVSQPTKLPDPHQSINTYQNSIIEPSAALEMGLINLDNQLVNIDPAQEVHKNSNNGAPIDLSIYKSCEEGQLLACPILKENITDLLTQDVLLKLHSAGNLELLRKPYNVTNMSSSFDWLEVQGHLSILVIEDEKSTNQRVKVVFAIKEESDAWITDPGVMKSRLQNKTINCDDGKDVVCGYVAPEKVHSQEVRHEKNKVCDVRCALSVKSVSKLCGDGSIVRMSLREAQNDGLVQQSGRYNDPSVLLDIPILPTAVQLGLLQLQGAVLLDNSARVVLSHLCVHRDIEDPCVDQYRQNMWQLLGLRRDIEEQLLGNMYKDMRDGTDVGELRQCIIPDNLWRVFVMDVAQERVYSVARVLRLAPSLQTVYVTRTTPSITAANEDTSGQLLPCVDLETMESSFQVDEMQFLFCIEPLSHDQILRMPATLAIADGLVVHNSRLQFITKQQAEDEFGIAEENNVILVYADNEHIVYLMANLNKLATKIPLDPQSSVSELEHLEYEVHEFIACNDENDIPAQKSHVDLLTDKLDAVKSQLQTATLPNIISEEAVSPDPATFDIIRPQQQAETWQHQIISAIKDASAMTNKPLSFQTENQLISQLDSVKLVLNTANRSQDRILYNLAKKPHLHRDQILDQTAEIVRLQEQCSVEAGAQLQAVYESLQDARSRHSIESAEKYFLDVRNFQDTVQMALHRAHNMLQSMLDKTDSIRKTLEAIRDQVHDLKNILNNLDGCAMPLRLRDVENGLTHLYKVKREAKTLANKLDKFEKSLEADFYTNPLHESERALLQQVKEKGLEELERRIQEESNKLDEVRHGLSELQECGGQLHKEEVKYRKRINVSDNADQLLEIKQDIIEKLSGNVLDWTANRDRLVTREGFTKKDELMHLKEPLIVDNLLLEADRKITSLLEKKLDTDQIRMNNIEREVDQELPKQLTLDLNEVRLEEDKIKQYLKWLVLEPKSDYDKLKLCEIEHPNPMKLKQIENQIFSLEEKLEDKSNLLIKEYEPLLVDFLTNQNDSEDKLDDLEQKLEEENLNTNELEVIEEEIKGAQEMLTTLDCYGAELCDLVARRTRDPGTQLAEEVKKDMKPLRERLQELSASVKERADELKLNSQSTDLDAVENEEIDQVRERVKQERDKWNQLQQQFQELGPLYSYPSQLHKQMGNVSQLLRQLSVQQPEYAELQSILAHVLSEAQQGGSGDKASPKLRRSKSNEFDTDQGDNKEDDDHDGDSMQQWTQNLRNEVNELDSIVTKLTRQLEDRNQKIEDIVPVSEVFWSKLAQIKDILADIQKKLADNKESDDELQLVTVPVQTLETLEETVLKRVIDYQAMEANIEECQKTIDTELSVLSSRLVEVGGRSCKLEVEGALETVTEDTHGCKETLQDARDTNTREQEMLNDLVTRIRDLEAWLTPIEDRVFQEMVSPVDPDQRMMQLRLLELQAVQSQLMSRSQDVQSLGVHVPVHVRYDKTVEAVVEFQKALREKCVEIGELDTVLEEYHSTMLELENQIKNFTPDRCVGDADYSRACLKNLQAMIASYECVHEATKLLENRLSQSSRASFAAPLRKSTASSSSSRLSGSMRDLSASFRDILNVNSSRGGSMTVYRKWKQLDKLVDSVSLLIPEKQKMVRDLIRQEQDMERELQKHLEFLTRKNNTLKNAFPNTGLDVDVNKDILKNYQACLHDLEVNQRPLIEATVASASAIVTKIRDSRRTEKLAWLVRCVEVVYDKCKERCKRKIEAMKCRVKLVEEWVRENLRVGGEIARLKRAYLKSASPSKLTARCRTQIHEIKQDSVRVRELYEELSVVQEWASEIQNVMGSSNGRVEHRKLELEMRESRLQLDKVARAIQQRDRIFAQQYKMDKEFSDGHEALLKWLDKSAHEMESLQTKTQNKLQDHLDSLKDFSKQLSAQYANMHATIRHGTYLMDRCTTDNPEKQILKDMIMEIKNKWAAVRKMLTSGKKAIMKKISETGDLREAIQCFEYWVEEMQQHKNAEDKHGLRGDADTVEMLLQDCEESKVEALEYLEQYNQLRERLYKEVANYEEFDMRDKVENVQVRFQKYLAYMEERIHRLRDDSAPLAKTLKQDLERLQDWMRNIDQVTQKDVSTKTVDPAKLRNQLDWCEQLRQQSLTELKEVMETVQRTVSSILESCYRGCRLYVQKLARNETGRFRDGCDRVEVRIDKLRELLGKCGDDRAIWELQSVITLYTEELKQQQESAGAEKLPGNLESAQALLEQHKTFQAKVDQLRPRVLKLINPSRSNKKRVAAPTKSQATPPHCHHDHLPSSNNKQYLRRSTIAATSSSRRSNTGTAVTSPLYSSHANWSASRDALNKLSTSSFASNSNLRNIHEEQVIYKNPLLNALNTDYNQLLKLMAAHLQKLKDNVATLKEKELLANFNLSQWKTEFNQFARQKGLRLTDIFRRQAVVQSGHLSQSEFVSCLSRLGLHPDLSAPAILARVFTSFLADSRLCPNSLVVLSYQEFIDSLKPEKKKPEVQINPNDAKAVTKFIHDTIELEVARCQCQNRFHVKKEGENKYRFGSNSKMYMVRYLNSVVMVRIGGGWQTLPQFLKQHDPCRTAITESAASASSRKPPKTPASSLAQASSPNAAPATTTGTRHSTPSSHTSKIPRYTTTPRKK